MRIKTLLTILSISCFSLLSLSSCSLNSLPPEDRAAIINATISAVINGAVKVATEDVGSGVGSSNVNVTQEQQEKCQKEIDGLSNYIYLYGDWSKLLSTCQDIRSNQQNHDTASIGSIKSIKVVSTEAISLPCVTTDPTPSFCPRVSAPSLRPGAIEHLRDSGVPPGIDLGATRLNPASHCYEVFALDSSTGQYIWRNYNHALDFGSANKFHEVGPGWSLGHTSDDAFSFSFHYNELHPENPMQYEDCLWIQYEYNSSMRNAIKGQWCQAQPSPKPAACGGSNGPSNPPPVNPPPVEPPVQPPVNPPVTPPITPPGPPITPPGTPPAPVCPAGLACRPEPTLCKVCEVCKVCEICKVCEPCKTCEVCSPKPVLKPVPSDILATASHAFEWVMDQTAKNPGKRKEALRRVDQLHHLNDWIKAQQACQPVVGDDFTKVDVLEGILKGLILEKKKVGQPSMDTSKPPE